MRFRHYDPTPGMCRWLERDPAGYQDGPSLYSYLGRNPMAGTDPYGLFCSGSGITVLGPDQIRPPVPAHELVQPPRYGLKLAAIWPGSPGYDEILAQAEALSAIAKSNAKRGVDEGGRASKMSGIGSKTAKAAKAPGAMARGGGTAGRAALVTARVHENSLRYPGETHVYRIIGPNGKTYRIGASSQGVTRSGESIRAKQQARRVTRETGEQHTSEIGMVFANKAATRAYERDLIERFRSLYGPNSLPGNLTSR